MLVDVDFIPYTDEEKASYRASISKLNKEKNLNLPTELHLPFRIAQGMYGSKGFAQTRIVQNLENDQWSGSLPPVEPNQLHNYVERHRQHKRRMDRIYSQKYNRGPFRFLDYYGLCDSPGDLLTLYPHLADDDIGRVITFVLHRREGQYASGGMRYHKQGTYHGRQRLRSEYFYDDTHIDELYGFHIYIIDDVISG